MDFLERIRTRAQGRRLGSYLGEYARHGVCELQHDMNAANASGATVRGDYNNALVSLATLSSGATAPATTFAYQLWADTSANVLKRRNAANTGWLVVRSLDETTVLSRSSNTILGLSDIGKTIVATSTFTQTLTAAATLADGWWIAYRNNGTGIITIDANSTETIDGAQALVLQAGESCILGCNGSSFFTTGRARTAAFAKVIHGLTYDNGTDAVNDLNINTGGAMDATGAYWMTLATALGKQSDVAWAVGGTTGAPAGGLDTGAVGNSDYYIWLIARSDTGVVDALFSLSATAPTMPANYDFKRLIGWFKRVGGTVVACHTYETAGGGMELLWDSPTLDIDLTNTLTNSRRTDVIKVPTGFSVLAHVNAQVADAGAAVAFAWIYCPDQADLSASQSAAPLTNIGQKVISAGGEAQLYVRTSATGTIAARGNLATIDNYRVSTLGFQWSRR